MGRQKVFVTLPNGEQVWITGETTAKLVNNAIAKCTVTVDKTSKNILFGEYALSVFNTFLVKKWKQSTACTNRFLLDKHIIPFFGDMDLNEITPTTLQNFYDTKTSLSRSYTKQMHMLIHQVFDNAVEDELVARDPTRSKRITLPDKVTARKALTEEELIDITINLTKLGPEDALLLALLIFTGMRRGEVLGLKWENVFENVIKVRSEAIYKGNQPIYNDYVKSYAGIRDIAIAPALKPYLSRKEKGFVIGDGDTPITQSRFDRAWQRIGKTIDLHGATPHVLRHTYATMLIANNTDPKSVQAILGHADCTFTMNRYVHPVNEKAMTAVISLSDRIVEKRNKELTQNDTPQTIVS